MTPVTRQSAKELFDRFQQRMQRHMRQHWKAYVLEGIILTAIGSAAVVMPNIATLAADEMIGWLLMVAGLSVIIARLTRHESPDVWQGVLFGGLTAILGGLIAFYPASGVVTLTMLLTAYFIAHGIGMLSMYVSSSIGRVWMILGAVFDFTLAALVLARWPSTATWILGLYLGMNLIFSGLGLAVAALGTRYGRN